FVIFEAAYFGEIVRAGIQSVPRGQVEAATAVGLTFAQTMRFVVLPQAIRDMVPALVTQMIVLFKDTSLASIIGYVDLTKAAQIVNNREIKPFDPPVRAWPAPPATYGDCDSLGDDSL